MQNQFVEIPASNMSIAHRSLVFGVGINDADYSVHQNNNGKQMTCPYYSSWKNMIRRCFSGVLHSKYPTYIGCVVCDEWLTFSAFKAWMMRQDWQGKHLDKDILVQGNKKYGPDLCLFVTGAINNLITNRRAARGGYPQGVSFCKVNFKYSARCRANSKNKWLGYHDTPELAHEAHKEFKYKVIANIAEKQSEPLRSALLRYKIE